MSVTQVQVIHIGRRVQAPQRPVQVQRRRSKRNRQALREHDLHNVAIDDVLLGPFHGGLEALAAEAGDEVSLCNLLWFVGAAVVGRRASQARRQLFQARLRIVPGAGMPGVGEAHEKELPTQIVEDHHLVRCHEQDVGHAQGVGIGACPEPRLDVTDRVVAEVTNQPACKTRQPGELRSPISLLILGDPRQGVGCPLFLERAVIGFYADRVAADHEASPARQPDNGVASPFLSAVHGLQEIGVGASNELQVGAEGRIQIREDLANHGYPVVSLTTQL